MKGSRKVFVLAFASLGALLSASCGSDDSGSGGGGSCGSVCACVVAEGGDNDTCQQECAASISAGGNVKQSCELKLDGYGLPQCKSKCAGFPTGG
ncbi:MAG: hypothetical protein IPI67_05585 [Myxococcales bacterium]|nr:hypothetical protein [Myxococcales bacterium]